MTLNLSSEMQVGIGQAKSGLQGVAHRGSSICQFPESGRPQAGSILAGRDGEERRPKGKGSFLNP